MYVILFQVKKIVCVCNSMFMGQFYVDNLRTLSMSAISKKALLSTAVSTEGLSITALP